MISCRICIEQVEKPVSLPCGHIFCANCIVQAIRAVKHFTNFHPCSVCRSVYNIAPVNMKVVPPNLRLFVTPSIRRLYIDSHTSDEEKGDAPDAATSSEISRLQAENHALNNQCVMWRRHAEMQASINLKLTKLAHTIRDQASHLARERDEFKGRRSSLKCKLDDDESWTRDNATSCSSHSEKTEEFPGTPLSSLSSFSMSPASFLPSCETPYSHFIDGTAPPSKRLRIDSLSSGMQGTTAVQCARSATDGIAMRQKEMLNSMPSQ